VTSGEFLRQAKFRLLRRSKVVWEGDAIDSLRRFKDDVNKVAKGVECGVAIPYSDVRVGDKLIAYTVHTSPRRLTIRV
jgi:translation initiation factor IF-2